MDVQGLSAACASDGRLPGAVISTTGADMQQMWQQRRCSRQRSSNTIMTCTMHSSTQQHTAGPLTLSQPRYLRSSSRRRSLRPPSGNEARPADLKATCDRQEGHQGISAAQHSTWCRGQRLLDARGCPGSSDCCSAARRGVQAGGVPRSPSGAALLMRLTTEASIADIRAGTAFEACCSSSSSKQDGTHCCILVAKQELCIICPQAGLEGSVYVHVFLHLNLALEDSDGFQQLFPGDRLLTIVLPWCYKVPRAVVIARAAGSESCAAAEPLELAWRGDVRGLGGHIQGPG